MDDEEWRTTDDVDSASTFKTMPVIDGEWLNLRSGGRKRNGRMTQQ